MQNEIYTNYFNPGSPAITPIWTPTYATHAADKKSIMKWKDFIKKYPNYSRYRFSSDKLNGFVSFIFNVDEYTPINADGTFNKEIFHFDSHDTYPPENIHTFLNAHDKETFEKESASVNGFPKKYKLSTT